MEAWRLIQNNAIETRNADLGAMIGALSVIATNASARANRLIDWRYLGSADAWDYMTDAEKSIFNALKGRIEASW